MYGMFGIIYCCSAVYFPNFTVSVYFEQYRSLCSILLELIHAHASSCSVFYRISKSVFYLFQFFEVLFFILLLITFGISDTMAFAKDVLPRPSALAFCEIVEHIFEISACLSVEGFWLGASEGDQTWIYDDQVGIDLSAVGR